MSKTNIPESYEELDCCARCAYAFIKKGWGDPREYYCHFDKSDRPLCGSPLMKEFDKNKMDYNKWDKWADKHEVKAWGWCLHFKIEEE